MLIHIGFIVNYSKCLPNLDRYNIKENTQYDISILFYDCSFFIYLEKSFRSTSEVVPNISAIAQSS